MRTYKTPIPKPPIVVSKIYQEVFPHGRKMFFCKINGVWWRYYPGMIATDPVSDWSTGYGSPKYHQGSRQRHPGFEETSRLIFVLVFGCSPEEAWERGKKYIQHWKIDKIGRQHYQGSSAE